MTINTNPLEGNNDRNYDSNYGISEQFRKILDATDKELVTKALHVHDEAVQLIYLKKGELVMEGQLYDEVLQYTLKQNKLEIDNGKIIPLVVQVAPLFNTFNPMEHLTIETPEKPYRRNRRKVSNLNQKVLLEFLYERKENPKDLYPMSIRKTLSSDPTKDKVVHLTNIIYDLITALDSFSTPRTERYSNTVNRFYAEMIDDIKLNTLDGGVYDMQKLISLIQGILERTVTEMDSLYLRCYRKVGLETGKKLTTRKSVKVQITQEPIEIRQLASKKDTDIVKLLELQKYYNLINII